MKIFIVYGIIKDVLSFLLGVWVLYVELIEQIPVLRMDWMLSWLGCLHGTHSNGIGQGPNSDIEAIKLFMENPN